MASGTLRSFRHPSFRLFLAGQFVSMVGYWMQQTAQGWLVYRLTRSSLALGLVGFAAMLPVLLFGLWGGVEADRRNKRRLMLAMQVLAMLQASALSWLTLSGRVEAWHVGALAFLLGIANAFDMPARQSFFVEMVGPDDLPNAIALNSSMINVSRMIGPAAAGFLLAWAGEGVCFAVNAVTYLALIGALAAMRPRHRVAKARGGTVGERIRQGVAYARRRPILILTLQLLGLLSFVGVPYMVLMPVMAEDVLRGGPRALGGLTAASGVGAVFGALLLARRTRAKGLEHVMAKSVAVFGVGAILFALSGRLWMSLLLIPIAGYGLMMGFASSNTLLQSLSADEMRGRVMSLFTVTFMGVAPFGSLWGGAAARLLGAPGTLILCGMGALAGAWWYHRRVHGLAKGALELEYAPLGPDL